MKNCLWWLFSCLGFFCFGTVAQAQLAQPLQLNANNTTAQATINVVGAADANFIRLVAFDPDNQNEGQMFINGQGPVALFAAANGAFDNQEVSIDIPLSPTLKAALREGANTFRFEYLATAGFEIRDIVVVGDLALEEYEASPVNTAGASDQFRMKALQLYQRLVGVKTGIDNPKIVEMANLIQSGQAIQAAAIATDEPGFYNNVVRDFGARMSTIEQTANAPMSDMVATVIGVTRDEVDARNLLTGQFFYMGNANTPVPNNVLNDIVKSNNHYQALEEDGYDFSVALGRMDSQYLRGPNDNLVEASETAGVVTSRAFMMAHGEGGTNRRLVEYTMQIFTCNPLTTWADSTSSDIRVGRDVDRFPGGDPGVFKTQCKSCHGNMDGFRGAFAKFDFVDGFTKFAPIYPNGQEGNVDALPQNPIGVAAKYNRNGDVFSGGYVTADSTWVNFARSPANQELFGWRGNVASGTGISALGQAVANSRAFSKCMVKRVFREICNRDTSLFEVPLIESMSASFEQEGYKLKSLFEKISVRPECAGK